MTTPLRIVASALLLCTAAGVQAQKLSPGLWENSTSMKSADGKMEAAMAQAQAQMATLPPEQRKMMQDMMAKQGVALGDKANTLRVCLSKEQVERDEIPQDAGQCTRQSMTRSGNTVKFKFACTGERPTTGEGEYTLVSDKAYTGRTVVTTTGKGKAEQMTMTVSGKWLSADCGTLKPRP